MEKPKLYRIIFQFGSENETKNRGATGRREAGKDVKNFLTIDLKSCLKLAEIDCLLYTNRPTHTTYENGDIQKKAGSGEQAAGSREKGQRKWRRGHRSGSKHIKRK